MTAVTWNPSDKDSHVTLSGGDLTATSNSTGNRWGVRATLSRSSGAYYFEVSVVGHVSSIGLKVIGSNLTDLVGQGTGDYGFYYNVTNYQKRHNGSATSSDSGSYVAPTVFMVAVDFTAGKLWFGYNGTWAGSGNPAAGTNPAFTSVSGTLFPSWAGSTTDNPSSGVGKFKTGDFTYSTPSGFSPWEDAPTNAAIAATEAPDFAAPAASATTGAAIAAIEARDAAAIVAVATQGAAVAATEAPDVAAMVATAMVATIAAAERRDSAVIATAVTTGAAIAIVEHRDRVRVRINRATVPVERRPLILLYEPIPLRTSGALGDFATEFVLAHRYGDLGRFKLDRMSDTEFFVADHPMTVTKVYVDAQETRSWAQRTRFDGAGNTWTVVVLAAPAPAAAELSATGIGKLSRRTGAPIENPADIIEDFFLLAGRTDRWWDQLRAEAGAEDLRLAWSLDTPLTLRAAADLVCNSAGAIWCPGMARLYPVAPSGYIGLLDKNKVKNLVVRANLDNSADVLRLYYDPDKAGGNSQHFIELEANPGRYDGLAANLTFECLRKSANAETVAQRVLPWLSGERYDTEFDCEDPSVKPGQWRRLVAHPQWPFGSPDPVMMILRAAINHGTRTMHCESQVLVTRPAASVSSYSAALPTTKTPGVEVEARDGTATFRVRDANGRAVAGAQVSLDGGAPKKSGADGAVTFTVDTVADQPKDHTVVIKAPGKRAQKLIVPL